MQRIIQINISGRLIPIEEDAYFRLRDYIQSLKRRFTGADGEEIISDIENRIAELFLIRLQGGTPAIDSVDVGRVVAQLGDAGDLGGADAGGSYSYGYSGGSNYKYRRGPQQGRLRRDPFDKVVGGVCRIAFGGARGRRDRVICRTPLPAGVRTRPRPGSPVPHLPHS